MTNPAVVFLRSIVKALSLGENKMGAGLTPKPFGRAEHLQGLSFPKLYSQIHSTCGAAKSMLSIAKTYSHIQSTHCTANSKVSIAKPH